MVKFCRMYWSSYADLLSFEVLISCAGIPASMSVAFAARYGLLLSGRSAYASLRTTMAASGLLGLAARCSSMACRYALAASVGPVTGTLTMVNDGFRRP